MFRFGGTLAVIGLLGVLAAVLYVAASDRNLSEPFGRGSVDPTADALRQEEPPPYVPDVQPAIRGAITVLGSSPASEPVVTVVVNPPDDAVEMQLATSPTFVGATWEPVADRVEFEVGGPGYREIFARFRLPDGGLTGTSVTGIEVDPTLGPATASEEGNHQASWVRPFSTTELVVRIEAGRIEAGALEPYDLDEAVDGDSIATRGDRLVVRRDGEVYGFQVSARDDVIRRPDQLIGRPLDVGAVTRGGWTVTSVDDEAYASEVEPLSIRHLARPSDGGIDGSGDRVWAVVHDLVITLPAPLQAGATYTITPPTVDPFTLVFDPVSNVSPAVRVNQVGFAPRDRPKAAKLSGWYDGIGDTALASISPEFQVIEVGTGAVAYSGVGLIRSQDDLVQGDVSGSVVVELDFSPLERPGRYRVCVDQIGCSHDFEIADEVWTELASTVARAVYYQRSGLELTSPHASFVRPRPYHPDDGVTVLASEYSLLEAQTATANTDFELLADLRTDEEVSGAWGGHFDAGDWDRRIQHLWFARNAAQLIMAFPEELEGLELNIPESGDQVPDLLDEALWTIDLYRRMQSEDGAVRGGVEASEHPAPNSTSWVEDLAVLAYAPDPYSSYVYGGVAAEMSVALKPYDPDRAAILLDSARRAIDWADREITPGASGDNGTVAEELTDQMLAVVAEQRMVAEAAMFLATGDQGWHDRFIAGAGFLSDPEPHLSCHVHTRCDAAWIYLEVDQALTDPTLRSRLEERFMASAEALVEQANRTAYGWSLENPSVPLVWGLGVGGSPNVSGLLRAYVVSGDERFRTAAVRSASVSLGTNPLGRSMLTGIGDDPVLHPQINDIKHGGLPTWAGTPIYGFHELNSLNDEQWVVDDLLGPAGVEPAPTELPYLWQWYDVDSIAQYNEFTVHQSHGEALLAFAILGATSSGP